MPAEQVDGFADNWAYLRTELHWLERLLMAAVAKQRKETKEIDRVAQSKADRATSHWWKGIITAEGEVAYDEYRKPTSVKTSYNSQIEAQIQVTQKRGIVLALPSLRERLGLSVFEKNVVLMSLAPEVNRRYAHLYRYLQGEESPVKTDLPTLDLVLRLLCKNDQEWRLARNHLTGHSRLIRYKLLNFLPSSENTLLNCPLKLSTSLVNYLLADQPTSQALDDLLSGTSASKPTTSTPAETATTVSPLIRKVPRSAPVLLSRTTVAKDWTDLVLPAAPLNALKGLAQRIIGCTEAEQLWEVSLEDLVQPGLLALLVGAKGTGKRLAAIALASELQAPLLYVDLATIDPVDYSDLLDEITMLSPTVLLIQSAHLWLKRSAQLPTVLLQQFWAERRQIPAITLFSVMQPAAVQLCWRQQFDQQIHFPIPNATERLLLWQQAFPPQVPLEPTINWEALAEQVTFSGGEIRAIGQEAMAYAAAETAAAVGLPHILQALSQRGKVVDIKPLSLSKRRSRKKS